MSVSVVTESTYQLFRRITDSFKNSLQGQLQKAHVKEYPDRDKKSPHIEMHDVVHDRWYGLPAITAFRAQQIAKHPTDEAIEASVWNNYTPQFILQVNTSHFSLISGIITFYFLCGATNTLTDFLLGSFLPTSKS